MARVFAMHPLALITGACLIALTIPLYRLLNAERSNVGAVPRAISEQGGAVRTLVAETVKKEVLPRFDKLAQGLDGRVGSIQTTLDKRVGSIQQQLFATVNDGVNGALQRVDGTMQRVDRALDIVDGLKKDLEPSLANIRSITAHVDASAALGPELTRNALGAVAAFKLTMGQTEKTMAAVQKATPDFLRTVQKIGENSDAATAKSVAMAEEGRKTLANMAAMTTPLPKWIRYPAQTIGLIGSAALPVIGIAKLARADTITSTVVRPVAAARAVAPALIPRKVCLSLYCGEGVQ